MSTSAPGADRQPASSHLAALGEPLTDDGRAAEIRADFLAFYDREYLPGSAGLDPQSGIAKVPAAPGQAPASGSHTSQRPPRDAVAWA